MWLASRAGKVNQILCCDWLLERARWRHLASAGLPAVLRKKIFPESHIINPLLTKLVPHAPYMSNTLNQIPVDKTWSPMESHIAHVITRSLSPKSRLAR